MATDDLTLRMRAQGARAAARELFGVERGVRGIGRASQRSGRDASRASRGFRSLTTGIGSVGSAAGLASVGVVGLSAGLAGYAVKSAMSFEKQLSALGAVSGATGAQMKDLRQQALDAGASTVYSARESALAQTELAKGGMNAAQILGGGLNAALALAAAGELELGDAAAYTSTSMNIFGIAAKDSMHVADALATAANKTNADVQDFGMALSQAGATAKLVGYSFDDTLIVLEALAAAGVKNSDAGTSMKAAFSQLISPSKKQAELQSELGLSFINSNGKMKDAADISTMLRGKLGNMTDAQRAATLTTLAGTDGVRALNAIYAAGPKQLDAYRSGLAKTGTAAEVARKKQDNLAGKVEQLKGAAETLAIVVGTALIPYLTDAAEATTDFISGMVAGTGAGGDFVDTLKDTASTIGDVAGFLWQHRDAIAAVTTVLLAAIVAYRATKVALGFISMVKSAILFYKLWRDGTLALAVAQMGLNGAMLLNPIGLIVAGVVALIAIIVIAYAKVGWFREGVNDLWSVLKWTPIGLLTQSLIAFVKFVVGIPGKIKTAFAGGIWGGIRAGLVGILNWAIGKINMLIDGFNKVNPFGDVKKIGKVSNPIAQPPAVSKATAAGTPTLTRSAQNYRTGARAMGGSVNQSGYYDVGEKGRERVWLPKGSNVEKNASVEGESGGDPITIYVMIDGKVVAKTVERQAKKKKSVR